MFGESDMVKEGKVVTVQSLSGTGSLRVGFEFIKKHCPADVYVSNPTWANHHSIIKESGLNVKEYPYWDPSNKALNFKGLM